MPPPPLPPPVEEDPELAWNEQWEAAALAATIEAFERQRLEAEPMEKRRRGEELEAEAMEMHKRRRVEELDSSCGRRRRPGRRRLMRGSSRSCFSLNLFKVFVKCLNFNEIWSFFIWGPSVWEWLADAPHMTVK